MTIAELKAKKGQIVLKMRGLLDKADDGHRDLTEAESRQYKDFETELDKVDGEILRAEARGRLNQSASDLDRTINPFPGHGIPGPRSTRADDGGFSNLGELLYTVADWKRSGRRDSRLDTLLESREQTMGTGQTGGFAIPTQFSDNLRRVGPQAGIVRPRANVIPAGSPPDAKFEFPILDQTAGKNMYGGVTVVHTGEGVTMTETTMYLRDGSLEPKEISGYIVCTNKMLTNWGAGGPMIEEMLRLCVSGTEDYDFLRGDGVNKALGVINSPAAISYARAGVNAVAWADVYNMYSRLLMGGAPCWVASQTIIPQLSAMVDAGNHAVWISGGAAGNFGGGASAPAPSTLMGLPLYFADRLPALGTKGDLGLYDFSKYLVKDGSGPFVASSEHILFLSNKTVFKIVWNVDAKPWLSEPIGLEGSTANTVSPFVVLT